MNVASRLKLPFGGQILCALVLTLCTAGTVVSAPTAGTILQQTKPPPTLPEPPGTIITLPGPKAQTGKSAVKVPIQHIDIKGNALLPTSTLVPLVQKLQGQTVTLGELQGAAEAITSFYHDRGYPLSYAYLPAQTIREGVVRIEVIETRYDRIELDRDSRLKSWQVQRSLGLEPDTPIIEDELNRGLLLLNQTPGVRVAGTFVPGAKPGTSTLQVRLQDTPPLLVSTALDNYGSDSSGRLRGMLNLGLDNPFGYGSRFGINSLTTESGLLHSVGFNALSPDLFNGLRLGFYGSHCAYELGGEFSSLQESGTADQFGLNISVPLILQPRRIVNARFDLLRDRLFQDSVVAGTESRSHINLLRFSLSGAAADTWDGSTSLGLFVSRGELVQDSTDAISGPPGLFWVGRLQAERNQFLPWQFRLRISLSGQLASTNLDGSQKFYLGGPYGVMSYPVNEAGGDEGLLLTGRLAHSVPCVGFGNLEAALLAQWGKVRIDHDPSAGATDDNYRELSGLGIELDYSLRDRLAIQLAYVNKVGGGPALAGPDHNGELWARLQLSF